MGGNGKREANGKPGGNAEHRKKGFGLRNSGSFAFARLPGSPQGLDLLSDQIGQFSCRCFFSFGQSDGDTTIG